MADDRMEAEQILHRFVGNADGMAAYLLKIAPTKSGVIYWVFELVNHQTAGDLACRFLKQATAPLFGTAQTLVQTNDGIITARVILWNLKNRPSGILCIITQSEIAAFEMLVNNAHLKPNINTVQPRKLSQTEMNFYVNYNQTPDVLWNFKKGKWNQAGPRVTFNHDICWDLPANGTGFTTYRIDDLKGKRNDKYGYDQIGTKETIEAMIKLASHWDSKHPNRKLQYGDISRPGGINTPDHGTHMTGKAFDMRLLRKDSATGGFTYKQNAIYDQTLNEGVHIIDREFESRDNILF